jgi:hypothetical protein
MPSRVEAVRTEIVDEAGIFRHLLGFHPEMINHDFFDPLANVAHFIQPRLLDWLGRCGAEPSRHGLVAWTMAGRMLIAGTPGIKPGTR